jgi:hypothetical protein
MSFDSLQHYWRQLEALLAPWEAWLWVLGVLSLLLFFASLLALPWAVARIPHDYFVREQRQRATASRRAPWLYWPLMLMKNVLGIVLLLAGLAMLVLPGQGLLTLLAGLLLMNFPGKYRLERALIERSAIHRSVNWLRARRGVLPLRLPNAVQRPDQG